MDATYAMDPTTVSCRFIRALCDDCRDTQQHRPGSLHSRDEEIDRI